MKQRIIVFSTWSLDQTLTKWTGQSVLYIIRCIINYPHDEDYVNLLLWGQETKRAFNLQ